MRIVAVIFGIVLIVLVAQDAFETIVLPRRVSRRIRLAVLYYRTFRLGWYSLARLMRSSARRDAFQGYMGPLSLLGLLLLWAVLFILGYGLLLWGLALPLAASQPIGFLTYLYLSSTAFFTLGLGDVTSLPGVGRFLVVSEAALGYIFLALVISYVPVLYQAFSRREVRISLLDARAGSPPTAVELLRRNRAGKGTEELRLLLHDWEVWCAEILESHLSYPILAYYRSQHQQQSWVEALTVILDTCALLLTSMEGAPVEAARFTFAAARHAVVDLAQVLGASPTSGVNRLEASDLTRVRERLLASGIPLHESTTSEQKLAELRATYEPFVSGLARQSGELAAQEQPQNGHQRLEEAKDQTGFEPGARVDARQTNTNGSGEVREAKGKTHQEQARPGEGRRRGCGEGPHDHTLLPDLSACAMSLYPTFSACRLTRGRQCSQWKATRGLS